MSLTSGRWFALAAAVSAGIVTPLTRLAYDGGGNPQTVIWVRFVITAAGIALVLLALRGSFRLPRQSWPRMAFAALCWTLISFGHLGAVFFIPVSLAALIFYTFPLMVLLIETLGSKRRLWVPPYLLAFAGLALALGPEFGTLDPGGIGLALLGAVAAALAVINAEKLVVNNPSITIGFWMQSLSALLGGAVLALLGGVVLPRADSVSGWVGLLGTGVVTVIAVTCILSAVRHAGPSRTALILNFEPVVILTLAALLLGERLDALQLCGFALVMIALVLSTVHDARRQPDARGAVSPVPGQRD